MAHKAFVDAILIADDIFLGKFWNTGKAKLSKFEIISSGDVTTFERGEEYSSKLLATYYGFDPNIYTFPRKFWQALKDEAVIRATHYRNSSGNEIYLGEIAPEFKISKNSWNLGNVIFKADRCTPGSNPCDNFEFSTGSVTTNPHQVESTSGSVNAEWMFIPGSKEAATTFTTSDSQTVTEETQKGAVIESGVEYGKGGSMTFGMEAKAGVNFKVFEAGGSLNTTLENNWSQTWSSKNSMSSVSTKGIAAESTSSTSVTFDPSGTQKVDGAYFHTVEIEEEVVDENGNVSKTPKTIEVGYEPYATYRTSIVRTLADTQILMKGKFQIDDQGGGGIGTVRVDYSSGSGQPKKLLGVTDLSVQAALKRALEHGGDHIDLEDELGLDASTIDFSRYNQNNADPLIFTSTIDAGTTHAYNYSVVTEKIKDSQYTPVENEESKWPNLNIINLIPSIKSPSYRAPLFRSKDYIEPTDEYLDSLGYYLEIDEIRPEGKRIEIEGDSNVNTVQLDSSEEQVAVKGFENSFITGNDDANKLIVRASSESNSINMNGGDDTISSRGDNFIDMGEGHDKVVYSGGQTEFVLGSGQDSFQINKAKASFLIDDYNPIDDFVFVGKGLDPNLLTAKLKDYVVKEERYEDDKILDHKVQFKYDDKEIGTARVDFMDDKVDDLIFNKARLHVYGALNSSAIDYKGFMDYLYSEDFTYSKAFEKLMLTSGLFKGGLVTPEDWSEMDLSEREVVVTNGFTSLGNTYVGEEISEITSNLPDTFSNSTASTLDEIWFA